MPIELCDKNGKTIDDKGSVEVYDANGKDEDTKRFCTLNLYGGMCLREDLANQVKPHLVFHASKFRDGDDWDEAEREQWDPRVVVSFQQNAWVDAETHMLAMDKVLGPVNDHLQEVGMKGLVVEDNLSSHKTPAVNRYWEEKFPNFLPPEFVPPNMTETMQVIDRHIGILYKRAVYRAMRAEMAKRLREARAAAGGAEGIVVQRMTPKEKRILITKAVADEHEKLTTSTAYARAFIATATWMPVYHLMSGQPGPSNVPEDSQVSLQHLSEYIYSEQCCREKILPAIEKINKEKEDARAEMQHTEAEQRAVRDLELVEMQPYVSKADSLMNQISEALSSSIVSDLQLISDGTGYKQFVIGGSWAAMQTAKAVAAICADDEEVDAIDLTANDCDVYHGRFTNNPEDSLRVK